MFNTDRRSLVGAEHALRRRLDRPAVQLPPVVPPQSLRIDVEHDRDALVRHAVAGHRLAVACSARARAGSEQAGAGCARRQRPTELMPTGVPYCATEEQRRLVTRAFPKAAGQRTSH